MLEGDLGSSDRKPLNPQSKQVPGERKALGQDKKPGPGPPAWFERGRQAWFKRLQVGAPAQLPGRSCLAELYREAQVQATSVIPNFLVATLKK